MGALAPDDIETGLGRRASGPRAPRIYARTRASLLAFLLFVATGIHDRWEGAELLLFPDHPIEFLDSGREKRGPSTSNRLLPPPSPGETALCDDIARTSR